MAFGMSDAAILAEICNCTTRTRKNRAIYWLLWAGIVTSTTLNTKCRAIGDNMQEVIKREEVTSHEDDRAIVMNLMLASMQTIAPLVEKEADNAYTVADLKIRFR